MISEADLSAFGAVSIIGPLPGGHRNAVYDIRLNGRRLVAKSTTRSAPALRWMEDLMHVAARAGFAVPELIPTASGALSCRGWTVESYLAPHPGGAAQMPSPDEMLPRLARFHAATANWPHRPGCAGLLALARDKASDGSDADMDALPPDIRDLCLSSWRAVQTAPAAAIHGDLGPGNLRMGASGQIQILDWDEARRDAVFLDTLPWTADPPATCRAAHLAWEVAVGWRREPAHARHCLARLRTIADA